MKGNPTRPLLAATLTEGDLKNLRYPLIGSPKIDGLRMRVIPGGGVSRKHLLLPNRYLQSVVRQFDWMYLDGEVVVGSPTDPKCFNTTQSAVMTQDGEPDFIYYIFDSFSDPHKPYWDRLCNIRGIQHPRIGLVQMTTLHNLDEVLEYEAVKVAEGYEGIMLRSCDGPYKYGRSTLNEHLLMKLKRFKDGEAVITGFDSLEHNLNEAVENELGYTKRSSHKANKVADDQIGCLVVVSPEFGEFSIGTGFTEHMRRQIWADQSKYVGKTITFKYQEAGMKDKPRFPVFKGFRAD